MHANITLRPREFVMALSSAALGGFIGTLLRDIFTSLEHLPALGANVSWPQEIPWALLAVNFVGVFFATRLLRGPLRGHEPNDRTRILIITGFLGGLTSYSGLFVSLATLWHVCAGGCLLVAVGAIASGVVAGWLGLLHHRQ